MRYSPIVPLSIFICITSSCTEKKESVTSSKTSMMQVSGIVINHEKLENVVRTSGTVRAFEEVDLRAETSGRIAGIYFSEGSQVKKDQLLLKINDDDLQAQLQKINLEIKLNEQQLGRQDKLLKISGTSQQEYDIAASQLASLKADKQGVLASIRKTEIRAPFTGVIGLRYISEGGYITPASQVASVQNINPVKIDFSIPEKYAGMVQKNDMVNFSNDATTQTFSGKVFAIEPKINLNTRSLQIRALCENGNGKIVPGTFARVDLRLKETSDALMIPTQSVIPVLKGQTVYITKNGKAKRVAVKTGIRTDEKIQITEGLVAGDTLITTGIMFLKPDAPLKVTLVDTEKAAGGTVE